MGLDKMKDDLRFRAWKVYLRSCENKKKVPLGFAGWKARYWDKRPCTF